MMMMMMMMDELTLMWHIVVVSKHVIDHLDRDHNVILSFAKVVH